MTDEMTLTPAELETLAKALHRGTELTADERRLYGRCDGDRTGRTGGALIDALDRIEAGCAECQAWPGGMPPESVRVHRATAADAESADMEELEAASEILAALRRTT